MPKVQPQLKLDYNVRSILSLVYTVDIPLNPIYQEHAILNNLVHDNQNQNIFFYIMDIFFVCI